MAKFGFGIGSRGRNIMDIVDGYQRTPKKKKKATKKKATKRKSSAKK